MTQAKADNEIALMRAIAALLHACSDNGLMTDLSGLDGWWGAQVREQISPSPVEDS